MNTTNQAMTIFNELESFGRLNSDLSRCPAYKDGIDNNDVIEDLTMLAVKVQTILDKETFIFSDSSFITRDRDQYWYDNDVKDFLFIEEQYID